MNQTLEIILNGMSKIPSLTKKSTIKEECNQVCNAIESIAKQVNRPLRLLDGTIHCYNGKSWLSIPSDTLKVFLKCSYRNLTGNIEECSRIDLIEGLYKQLPYTLMSLPIPVPSGLINLQNGVLDTRVIPNTVMPHHPNYAFRYVLPYSYTGTESCPMFMSYLDEVLPEKEAQDVLSEYIGWLFLPDLKLEKVLFLHGSGCNGKSVFVEIIEALLGEENISHESLSDMCGETGDRSRANLAGKLVNTCSDVSGNAFSGDIFKRIASGEPISTRMLYKDICSITDYAKMIFCLNELPKTSDTSSGYYRRFLIVPFEKTIPKSRIDPELSRKIVQSELPGILGWVLKGRERLVQNKRFTNSPVCERVLEEYKSNGRGKSVSDKFKLLRPPFWK